MTAASAPVTTTLGADVRLAAWQVRYQQRGFWRNKRAAFFSLVFPVMFLVIFGGLNSGNTLDVRDHLSFIDFYTPGIMAYAVLLICFNTTAMIFASLRTSGILKRVRTTPMPWTAYAAGAVGSTLVVLALSIVLLFCVGVPLFGAHVPGEKLLGLLATLALGATAFTTLGIAASRAHRQARERRRAAQRRRAAHGRSSRTSGIRWTVRPRGSRMSRRRCRCARWPTACRPPSTRASAGRGSSGATCSRWRSGPSSDARS